MADEAAASGTPGDGFEELGVVALRADWTNRDAAIASFLRSFGRTGIPFYAFYPSTGAPRPLPEVLTEGLVIGVARNASHRALQRAGADTVVADLGELVA